MIDKDLEAKILRYHFVEQWGVNTIARQLGIHHTTVDRVLSQAGLPKAERARRPAEAYLRLKTLPGEQGQVDWGLCRARHSAHYAEFQTMPSSAKFFI